MSVNTTLLLKRVAIGLMPICAGGSWFFYKKMQDGLVTQSYFPQAMRLLRQNPTAKDRLGEPIHHKFIVMSDTWNIVRGTNAQLKIRIKGSKRKGLLMMWATRPQADSSEWTVETLHLQTDNDPVLIIHDQDTHHSTELQACDISIGS